MPGSRFWNLSHAEIRVAASSSALPKARLSPNRRKPSSSALRLDGMDMMTTSGHSTSDGASSPIFVPISAFAELTAQAIILVDPVGQRAVFASTRACNLLFPDGRKPKFPVPLSDFLTVDDQLTDQLRLALMSSAPLTFGLTSRDVRVRGGQGSSDSISAMGRHCYWFLCRMSRSCRVDSGV